MKLVPWYTCMHAPTTHTHTRCWFHLVAHAASTVAVGLRPTAEARARYLENAAVIRGLEAGAALTDAQVDAIRGFATLLGQSGYRIDVRKAEDVTIDSDQVPQTMQWNSFWSRW